MPPVSQSILTRFVNLHLLMQNNASYFAIDRNFERFIFQESSTISKISSIVWSILFREMNDMAKLREENSRIVLFCSRNLHKKIKQAFIGKERSPFPSTVNEFYLSVEEAAKVKIVTTSTT